MAILLFVVLMLTVGINLWTDVIWYRSVGFDQVFWTRIGIQSALFTGGTAVALLVLLGNVWLAGRLAPAGGAGAVGGGTLRELARPPERGRRQRRSGPVRAQPVGALEQREHRGETKDVTPIDLPDPVPLGRLAIIGLVVLVALGVGGTLAGSWDTISLWQHRVPFDPSGTPVTDPSSTSTSRSSCSSCRSCASSRR